MKITFGSYREYPESGFPLELVDLIFVDDGSGDEMLSIIKSYILKTDMPVKVLHHDWKGLGSSRNVVASNASEKYII